MSVKPRRAQQPTLSWPLLLAVFICAYLIMLAGNWLAEQGRDPIMILAQAVGIAIVAAGLARLLAPPKATPDHACANESEEDAERVGPYLAPRVINDTPQPRRLDLRGLTINLLEMMALAERYDRELTLLMISVDNIDVIKKDIGAKGQQRVYQEIGDILSETLRIPDRSGHYGENQFLVILPETDVSNGRQTAERIRRQVVDTEIRVNARNSINTTVSIGVAAFKLGDDPQGLLSRAESALEEAGELGSNRTVQWTA